MFSASHTKPARRFLICFEGEFLPMIPTKKSAKLNNVKAHCNKILKKKYVIAGSVYNISKHQMVVTVKNSTIFFSI